MIKDLAEIVEYGENIRRLPKPQIMKSELKVLLDLLVIAVYM